MDCSTVFALTPPSNSYPPYLNVTRIGEGAAARYLVTVRSPPREMIGGTMIMGDVGQIELSRDELIEMSRAVGREH